jgi:hypothetical protein
MTVSGRRWLALAGLALLAAAARAPLHAVTHALPVSNDDAIPLLMARHVLRGEMATILWNQPYNGALDAYLMAPLLLVAPPHAAFRLYEALCGLLLIAAAGLVAREVAGAAAGFAAALLAAVGTPYMALMAATGPPPNFLMPLLVAAPVWAGLRRVGPPAETRSGTSPAALASAAAWGIVCGLAVWNSALALPALAGAGLGLVAAGLRPRAMIAAAFAAGFALGASPLLVARAIGASAASTVTAVRPQWLWWAGVTDLGQALSGLYGLEVPLVVDGPERAVLPTALRVLLGMGLVLTLAAAATNRRPLPLGSRPLPLGSRPLPLGSRALPLGVWTLGLAAAFAFSRRTGPDEIRYLFGTTVPVLALLGCGVARAWRWRRWAAAGAIAAIAGPWLLGQHKVTMAWRDPRHAAEVWQVPPLAPALATLSRAGVRSAYASLQFAGRIALESEERVIASQAWNERIPGDPLRFRDEVDLDPAPAWVLSPHLSRGMPRAARYRELLRAMGGSWKEDVAGDLVIFRRFVPPYDEARPVPVPPLALSALDGSPLPEAVRDADPATSWTSPLGISRGTGVAVRLDRPRRLSALVLGLDPERSPLAVPWVCEVDGTVVARGPAPHGLQWVNGAPRAGRQALLAIPLQDRLAAEVRLIFQAAGPPLVVSGVFLYGPDEESRPAAGSAQAASALDAARAGDWDGAVRLYDGALALEPQRASYHAALARARWRAAHRRRLDVESLGDGGAPLVTAR